MLKIIYILFSNFIFVDEYLLVIEYADGGTLRNYLEENFLSLNWHAKYRLALQLSSAIECLHNNGIVHKDLNSKNFFVQQNSIKLADFGLRKHIEEISRTSLNSFDAIPYIAPEGFDILTETSRNVNSSEGERQIDKLNEKSNIWVLNRQLSLSCFLYL